MHKAHIDLHELPVVVLMLQRIAFHLSGKVVALHLNNSTAEAYLCNPGGLVPIILSRLACHELCLADMHGISFIPAYIPTHLKVEADYLLWIRLVPKWHFLPHIAQAAFQPWGQLKVYMLAPSCTNQCQHYYILENLLPLGTLGLNALNHPSTYQVRCIPPPALVSLVLSTFLAELVMDLFRLLILVASCWMEAPWLPTVLNILEDIPRQCHIIKDLIWDILVDQMLKGLPLLNLIP